MEKIKILVVDDESRMRKLVRDFLVREGYVVLEAGDGMEAMDIFYEDKDIALVILDVMMPKMDGWQVCREIREHSKVPVIMLTARSDERDELQGFELGVDEYISKPFSPKILVARVEAILRRTLGTEKNDVINAGGILIDKAAHIVKIDDRQVDLSYKEFELLSYFVGNQGIALSREKILNHVWNYAVPRAKHIDYRCKDDLVKNKTKQQQQQSQNKTIPKQNNNKRVKPFVRVIDYAYHGSNLTFSNFNAIGSNLFRTV